MATIKDVAREAGVSVSTVSRVINSSGYVSESARLTVSIAMRKLNFSPSAVARGLVSGATNTVGLLIPDVSNLFFAEIARGIEDAAIQNGFATTLCNYDWKIDREKMYLGKLRQMRVDGIILAASPSKLEGLLDLIGDVPLVVIDRRDNPVGGSVWMNNESGGELATQHLLEIGCKKLVHIAGPRLSPSAAKRKKGFLRTIEEAKQKGMNIRGQVYQGDFRFRGGFDLGYELLSSNDRPDGIFASNDVMAIGVVQAAQTLGVSIPDEVAVIGYDNIDMGEYIYPKLSTIDQPGYMMGNTSWRMLTELMQSGKRERQEIEFVPKLIVRDSTTKKGKEKISFSALKV